MDNSLVVRLRQMTGAGMMDCKAAMEEAGGDIEAAAEMLRKKGIAKAAKSGERETREGIVAIYVHSTKKMAAMVELLCETDFVARNRDFQSLANDIAMHIAATSPLYLSPDSVPQEVLDKEREIYLEEFSGSGKPGDIIDKIIDGKFSKYYEDVCLLNQKFVKDEDMTVGELIKQKIGVIGENIRVGRFARFEV